ncbi:MAG: ubiquinol-cytochrome c reductase iron-sulfur subunit [Pseudomonadota bacterium]|nr:ubiquinol-cytochrome c reductase iron-sulfur subunit [Pseudomonadota bacterium]MEC8977477.1 ubiquinol-cytochrome c reductase iron-sulfur subunit [Pseudomonadota bacterium]
MSSNDTVDDKKRQFLTHATRLVGCAGLAGVAVPLLTYLQPGSEARSQGEPVRVDLREIPENGQKTVLWRAKPVWIIHRSQQSLANLPRADILSDPNSRAAQQPDYARNALRSLRPDFLVLLGVCTHLGCAPTYRPDPGSIDANWPGGFYCSCHGSKFDLSGRVYKNMPAPTNLEVPPHYYEDKNTLIVGIDSPQSAVG